MSDHPADDGTLDALRGLVSATDPVPPEVTDFAKAALGWRRVDAELAEILSDSLLAPAAGVRSGGGPRAVSFAAEGLALDVEVHAGDGGIRILGQLAPPVAATVEAQRDDGSSAASARTDELGRFRLSLAAGARIRLRILRDDEPAVETAWLTV